MFALKLKYDRSRSANGLLVRGVAALLLIALAGCGAKTPSSPTNGTGTGGTDVFGGTGGASIIGTAGGFDPVGGAGLAGGVAGRSVGTGTAGRPSSGGGSGGGSATGSAGGGVMPSACNAPFAGVMGACATYPATSIAAMRNPPVGGCYELSHVGLVTVTDSPSEPRVYVQDPNGGDFSAILAKCAMTASHVCPAAVRDKIPLLSNTSSSGAQLSIRGYYQYGKVSGFEEFYIEDVIDECKMVPRPAPISLAVSEIARDARVQAKWFRRANVNIATQDPLVMYDFAPADLQLAQTQCPDFAGFAMISKSAGVAAAAGCTGTTSPAARAVDPREVLIGRQFFQQFLFTADCACTAGTSQKLLTPSSSVSGTVLGYLILELDKGSTSPYQIFEPAANKTFPLK